MQTNPEVSLSAEKELGSLYQFTKGKFNRDRPDTGAAGNTGMFK